LQSKRYDALVTKVVFLGNCQIFWLQEYYRRCIAPDRQDEVTYIDPRQPVSSQHRVALQMAELLVEQRLEFDNVAGPPDVTIAAHRHQVPQVSASFLWPFAGQPHPLNAKAPGLPFGPYPDELGDTFLNRMIADKVEVETAVEIYCKLDVNKVANLDRRMEISLGLQRERDAATGYRFADLIETSFRQERVFSTPNHPCVAVFRVLVQQFFARMSVGRSTIEQVVRSIRSSPFGPDTLPIHPNVGRHFGIRFATPDERYEQRPEGNFTFREYAERYMRFAWNPELAEGIALSNGDDPAAAGALLEIGLQRSPGSAVGHAAMSRVLARQNRLAEAVEAARRAVACAPDLVHLRIGLSHLLTRTGNAAAAALAAREAIGNDPDDAAALHRWAQIRAHSGRRDEAIAALRHACKVVMPHDGLEPRIHAYLNDLLAKAR
jgi:tetratricopeptide (TPR) repeat protein